MYFSYLRRCSINIFSALLVLFLVFLSFTLLKGTAHAQGVMALQEMLALKSIDIASMSPDEKRIAFTQNVPRKIGSEPSGPDWQELFIVKSKGEIRPLIVGNNQIERLHWSLDGKQLWLLMRRENDAWFNVYMIRPDGGEAIRVIAKNNHIHGFDLHPEGNRILYWYPSKENSAPSDKLSNKSTHTDVRVVNYEQQSELNHDLHEVIINGGKSTDLNVWSHGHVVSAQYSPDGKRRLIKGAASYIKDEEVMNAFFSVTDADFQEIVHINNRGKLAKAIFSPNGDKIAFIGAETPSSPDHAGLFITDISTSKTQKILTEFAGIVTDLSWPETHDIMFLADLGLKTILASKNTRRVSSDYNVLFSSGLILRKLDAPDDNNTMAIIANYKDHPNELFWYKKQNLLRITDSNPGLKSAVLGEQTIHTFMAQDSIEIQGVLISPEGISNGQALPTIIFVHGGPESHVSNGWLSSYLRPVHILANLGFRSFIPNYRGSTGRGDVFLKAGQKDYAGAEFDDLLAAKQWLVKKGYAKANQVGIAGGSYGGYAAAWAATKFSEHFKAAAAVSGISNNISKFGTTDIPSEMLQTHALSEPQDSWQTWLQASPIYYSDLHNTPLLIMHGQQDKRVHYSQSLELYRHLKYKNQAPVQLLLYPDLGHHVLDIHSKYEQANRLVNWFQQYLKNK